MIRRAFEDAWGVKSLTHCGCDEAAKPGVALFSGDASEPVTLTSPAFAGLLVLSYDPDRDMLWLVPPGVSGAIVVSGHWRRLQIFLPQASIDAVARDLGLPIDTRIEFEPGVVAAPEIGARVSALAAELGKALPMSQLELDELALELAFLLISYHARIVMPGIGSIPAETAAGPPDWGRMLVAAILAQARDSNTEISQLMAELLGRLAHSGKMTDGSRPH